MGKKWFGKHSQPDEEHYDPFSLQFFGESLSRWQIAGESASPVHSVLFIIFPHTIFPFLSFFLSFPLVPFPLHFLAFHNFSIPFTFSSFHLTLAFVTLLPLLPTRFAALQSRPFSLAHFLFPDHSKPAEC